MATNAQAKAYAERIASLEAQLAERTRERDEARQRLAEAAMEINCAGPVDHRIRVLKRENAEAKDVLRERAEKAEARARQDSEACDRMQRSLAKAEADADRNLKAYELIKGDIEVWIRRYDEQKAEVQRLKEKAAKR